MNEHRFWRAAYWVGRVDARPLALYRIGLGLILLWDQLTWLPYLRPFLTDEGILPRAMQDGPSWGAFALTGSLAGAAVIFALGMLATVLFTLGWRTRVMTALVWLFYVSLHHRNLHLGDGGDSIARMTLFWGMFTNLGGAWSLDARAGRRADAVPALGARLIQLEIAAIYLGAVFLKTRGAWLDHNVIYQVMQLDGFTRPPGTWLLDHPTICLLMTRATLAMEVAIPILVVSPYAVSWSRAGAILIATALQLGIFVTMRVGTFTGVMLWSSAVLVLPEWLDWLRERRTGRAPVPRAEPAYAPPSPAYTALAIALGLQFVASTVDAAYRTPHLIEREVEWTGLTQGLDLFSKGEDAQWWTAPGTLDDGTKVDVIAAVQPELQPTPGYLFNRWTKIRFRHPDPVPLSAYLCREYDALGTGHKLVSLSLEMHVHPSREPDDPPRPDRVNPLWTGPCP